MANVVVILHWHFFCNDIDSCDVIGMFEGIECLCFLKVIKCNTL